MNSELDRIKSTITISLGMRNRLKRGKGTLSYEEFIAKLLRDNDRTRLPDNFVEVQKFERKEIVHSSEEVKVVFTFNRYNQSPNFVFDIQITTIRKAGKRVLETDALDFGLKNQSGKAVFGYEMYFELLTLAIQSEVEPLFRHKGRMQDYYSWEKEFERLGLSKKAFESDVMEKLNDYAAGVQYT